MNINDQMFNKLQTQIFTYFLIIQELFFSVTQGGYLGLIIFSEKFFYDCLSLKVPITKHLKYFKYLECRNTWLAKNKIGYKFFCFGAKLGLTFHV
jgi:hypothetical protein